MKKLLVQARCRSASERATGTLQGVPVFLGSAIVTVCCFSPVVLAAPTGGTVVGGEGTIQQTSNTSTLISQTSQSLAINWDTFNIGADESVRFNQPSSSSVVLNRIVGQTPSEIFGHLDANGRVFLINPNGLLFGQSAMINVGSLFASSLDIDPQQFMQGDYSFAAMQGQTPGIVVNQGMIQAATGGSVSLVGGAVSNEGVIVANLGQVNLAAGRKSVIDFDGDGLIRFEVSDDVVNNAHALDSAVNNSGEIHADGGTVLMKGTVAADVFSQAVNNDGVIKATHIENKGGVIRLVGSNAPVVNSGTLDVSGQGAGSTGGTVEILGDSVALNAGSTINASGDAGGGTVLVGGDAHGSNPDIKNATQTSVSDNTSINADANINGDGGKVVVWSDDSTEFYGDVSVRGGAEGGDGGFVEISGKQHLNIPLSQVTIDSLAPMGNTGLLLLDPGTVTICAAGAGCTPAGFDVFDDAGINTTLATTSLNIKTQDASSGTEDINIVNTTGNVNISWTTNNFTLTAGNDINVASGTSFSGSSGASLNLNATGNINLGDGTGGVTSITCTSCSNSLTAPPAIIPTLSAGNNINLDGNTSVSWSGFDFQMNAGQDINVASGASLIGSSAGTLLSMAATRDVNLGNSTGSATSVTCTSCDNTTITAGNNINVDSDTSISWSAFNLTMDAGQNISVGSSTTSGASFSWSNHNDLTLTAGNDIMLGGSGSSAVVMTTGGPSVNLNLNFGGTLNLGTVNVTDVSAVTATYTNTIGSGTIVGQNVDSTWTVTGSDSGKLVNSLTTTAGIHFSGVGTVTGGSGDDTFIINGGSLTGGVNGGAQATAAGDTLDLTNAASTQVVTLGTTNTATDAGTFTGIETLVGNDTNATLTGPNSGVIFDVTSQNSGSVSSIAFSGFNKLTGGSGGDTFNLGADVTGTVDGGGGADIFNVTTALTGSLNGNTGNDTFNLGADVSGTVDGGGNDDTFNVMTAISSTLTGNTGNDIFNIGANESGTISGDAGNDTFNFNTAVQVVTVSGGADNDTMNFNATVTVKDPPGNPVDGGAGDDHFVFGSSGSLAGTITGGTGTDTIDLSAKTGAIDVNLANASATNINGGSSGGFATINAIVGGTGSNTVTGTSGGNTWAISGADIVTVSGGTLTSGVTLTNFSTLTGGSGNDGFQFGSSGSISGTINGGGGTDTLDYSSATGKAFTINLDNDSATELNGGAAGGFNSIEAVKGGGGDDILIGSSISANNWTINSANTGDVNGFGFTDMSNLVAGALGDTFRFGSAGSLSGTVTGGAGNDTLNFANVSTAVTVNLASNSASVINGGAGSGFSSIENVVGDGSNDVLVGSNGGNTWSITGANDGSVGGINFTNMSHLVAGSGNDTFQFANTGSSISGSIAGTGNDTLDFSTTGSAVTVNLADASATLIKGGAAGGISGISAVVGGGGDDTLIGGDTGNTWSIIAGTDSGSVGSVSFTDFSNLTAGSGGDTFHFASGSSISGKISGGAGSDTLNFTDTASAVTVDLSNSSATPVNGGSAGGFSSIESITGGGGDDTLIGSNGGNTWSLTGVDDGSVAGVTFTDMSNLTAGTGGDTFHFGSGSSVTGTVTGASGSDTLDFTDAATAVTVDLANTSATLIKGGASAGFSGIETFVGGGADDRLIAPDANNTWSISANDLGTVSSVGFRGFQFLQGGSLNDNFILDFNGATTRSLDIDGKAGVNSVTLTGGGSTADGTYNPASATAGTVTYSQNSNTETLALSQVNSLVDNRTANKLTVNGSSGNNNITLSGGSVGFSSLLNIAYANKTNLTVNGGAGTDTVDVTGAVSLPGTLDINAENITDSSGQTVSADTLLINGATTVGTSAARLITDIGNLQLTGIGGNVYISEASGLNLLASDIGADLVLTTAGAVTQSGALKVAGSSNIASGNNAITLDNSNNDFGGAVTLTNGGANNVTVNDANAMTIGKITSGGDVTATTQNGNLYLGKVYTPGAVTLTVNNGNLLGDNSTEIDPNIKASTLTITVPNGGIGSLANQIAVNVSNSTTLFSQQLQAFLTGPTGTLTSGTNLVINTSDIQGTAGRGQNIVVGNIYFIDPALFSQEFSLFNITDNGIRLPPDQIEEQ